MLVAAYRLIENAVQGNSAIQHSESTVFCCISVTSTYINGEFLSKYPTTQALIHDKIYDSHAPEYIAHEKNAATFSLCWRAMICNVVCSIYEEMHSRGVCVAAQTHDEYYGDVKQTHKERQSERPAGKLHLLLETVYRTVRFE